MAPDVPPNSSDLPILLEPPFGRFDINSSRASQIIGDAGVDSSRPIDASSGRVQLMVEAFSNEEGRASVFV